MGLPFSVPAFVMALIKNPVTAIIMLIQLALQMMTAAFAIAKADQRLVQIH